MSDRDENEDAKVIPLRNWREAPSSSEIQVRRCEHMISVGFGYLACGICGPLEPEENP